MRIGVVLFALFALCSSPAFADNLSFEDLTLNQVYDLNTNTPGNPSSFTTNGVDVSLSVYYLLTGGTTVAGSTRVSTGSAGGSGNEMFIANTNLNFNFGAPITSLQLTYSKSGGNINFEVNGDQQNKVDFLSLPATIGGVTFSTSGTGAAGSTLSLHGVINSFSIGGQELAIDNVSFQVPEPSTLALAGLALVPMLIVRRRLA
jgi:hypothetical protein